MNTLHVGPGVKATTEQRNAAQEFAQTKAGNVALYNTAISIQLDVSLIELASILVGIGLVGTMTKVSGTTQTGLAEIASMLDYVLTTELLEAKKTLEERSAAPNN